MRHSVAIATVALVLPATTTPRPLRSVRIAPGPSIATDALANDNTVAAGTLNGGVLTVALELKPSVWHPDGPAGVTIPIAAFAETGKAASIPGPMLRVVAGTEIRASVHNLLDARAVVHGLRDHDGIADSLVLAPGETRDVRFTASSVGTHFYFARTTTSKAILSRGVDSQLTGAFIVDPPGTDASSHVRRDRVFVITAWDDTLVNARSPYGPRQVYAINGLSWPHTERLSYTVGDTVRWRVVNVSNHAHPMHLHGFYFSVSSRGTSVADTLYAPQARRNAVTEFMSAATTMSLQWVPDRPGNWLYHCHFINHIDTALRLESSSHDAMSSMNHRHFADAMSGLVMAISVRDTSTTRRLKAPEPVRHRLRLFVTERPNSTGTQSSYGFVLQEGAREPAADSIRLPGSTLVLHQGEPTQITVINRAHHATDIHWHGMELESYYDGVAGWSGADTRTAPFIAPGDSFVVKLTPRRAGTFIYHSHADDLTQLTGGLYGALLVLPPHAQRDTTERVVILADSAAPDMKDTPPSIINGSSVPAPIEMRAGVTHRIRFIGISAISVRKVRLLDDSTLVSWKLLAKDGQDLPAWQQVVVPATARIGAGETMDVAFTPSHTGQFTLEISAVFGITRVTRVKVIVHPSVVAVYGLQRQ